MMFLLIVTIASMIMAAIMSVVAWRIAAEERRRSEARVAALAAEIHAPASAVPASRAAAAASVPPRVSSFASPRSSARCDDDLPIRPIVEHRAVAPDLFAQPAPARSRFGIVAAVGAIVVAAGIGLVVVFARVEPAAHRGAADQTPIAAPPTSTTQNTTSAAAASAVPLELVGLGHERDGDRLTVRGLVRNPSGGAAIDALTAIVFAFDGDGGFLASGRAPAESPSLRPGSESTFVVTVPGAARVGRYRVSFRSGDRVVPHVDRREPPKMAS